MAAEFATYDAMTGRRSLALRVLGLLWLLMGAVVATSRQAIDPAHAILYEALPIWARFALWTSTGLIALAASLRIRWQDVGWMALAAMPAERAISHAWSLARGLIPGEPPGTTWEGAASLLLWVGITHLVLILAGWDEDTHMDGRD